MDIFNHGNTKEICSLGIIIKYNVKIIFTQFID